MWGVCAYVCVCVPAHCVAHTRPMHMQVPELVQQYMAGETLLDKYITHTMDFDDINEAFGLLHRGETLRTVLTFGAK